VCFLLEFRGSSVEGKKAVEGVQRVAHMALVRVQTRTDDEA
jgi:hypothetical protein